MRRLSRAAAFAALCLVLLPATVWAAERRVALVIGNGDYSFAHKLRTPAADAGGMADKLRQAGFDVDVYTDLKIGEMRKAFQSFRAKADTADIALVYYSGHGMQLADPQANGGNQNYLIPTDANIVDARDADDVALSLNKVLAWLANARVRLVFLDACRDNPFLTASKGAGQNRGLARVDVQTLPGTMLVFSTQPGRVAADELAPDRPNSPFTTALLDHLLSPGEEIRLMLTEVRKDVYDWTSQQQLPRNDESLLSAVYLVPQAALPPPTTASLLPPVPAPHVPPPATPTVAPPPVASNQPLPALRPPAVPATNAPVARPAQQLASRSSAGGCPDNHLKLIASFAPFPKPPGVDDAIWVACHGKLHAP